MEFCEGGLRLLHPHKLEDSGGEPFSGFSVASPHGFLQRQPENTNAGTGYARQNGTSQ
jgi:hypothetical protein